MCPEWDTIVRMSTTTLNKNKTAYIRTRIRPDIKRSAERVLHNMGMSTSDAVSVFLNQVSLQNALPFQVKIPNKETVAAFNEDLSNAKRYTDVDDMMDDLWPKN